MNEFGEKTDINAPTASQPEPPAEATVTFRCDLKTGMCKVESNGPFPIPLLMNLLAVQQFQLLQQQWLQMVQAQHQQAQQGIQVASGQVPPSHPFPPRFRQ